MCALVLTCDTGPLATDATGAVVRGEAGRRLVGLDWCKDMWQSSLTCGGAVDLKTSEHRGMPTADNFPSSSSSSFACPRHCPPLLSHGAACRAGTASQGTPRLKRVTYAVILGGSIFRRRSVSCTPALDPASQRASEPATVQDTMFLALRPCPCRCRATHTSVQPRIKLHEFLQRRVAAAASLTVKGPDPAPCARRPDSLIQDN